MTLLQNFKRDDKLGGEFECPVCRLPSKSPANDTTDINTWVQELYIDKELQTKVGKQNEQDAKWCGQCRYVEKFIKSEVYCSTCQESYCGKCSEMLHSFKMNRDHAIIDIKADGENDILNEQAVQLLQTFITCSVHPDKKVEFFCNDEESFCCIICVTDVHQGCKNMVLLKDLVNNNDDGKAEENDSVHLLNTSSKLDDHIKSIISLIKEKDAETKKTPENLKVEFQRIKEKMVRLLDAAEEKIAQDSKAFSKAISMNNVDEIEFLNAASSENNIISYLLGNLVPKLPSDCAKVCCKNAKIAIHHLERKILERGSSFQTEELKLNINEQFGVIMNLGPNETEQIMFVESNPKSHPFPSFGGKFLLREGKVEKVGDQFCVSDLSPEDKPRYNCVTFLPDNNLVLTDSYYGICLLLDGNLQPSDSVNFQINEVTEDSQITGNFIYSAYLANNLLALSVLSENKIYFMSASNGKLAKKSEILCKYRPTAIHGLRNGDLFVLWEWPDAFGIISQCGGSYKEKLYVNRDSNCKLIKHNRRMVVDEEKHHVIFVYAAGVRKADKVHTLVSYDFNGNPIFEHRLTYVKDPRGIALDADGNIYVCDHGFGKIHVLSPEGLLVRIISDGCPVHPLGIGFKKSMNMFAVTQTKPEYQKVLLFAIRPP